MPLRPKRTDQTAGEDKISITDSLGSLDLPLGELKNSRKYLQTQRRYFEIIKELKVDATEKAQELIQSRSQARKRMEEEEDQKNMAHRRLTHQITFVLVVLLFLLYLILIFLAYVYYYHEDGAQEAFFYI
ncbi:uncharacterized protein LOC131879458 [Tigriopus californicus]|nr:uncharacterized protein LOC131879458 [Tigriopus californicus]